MLMLPLIYNVTPWAHYIISFLASLRDIEEYRQVSQIEIAVDLQHDHIFRTLAAFLIVFVCAMSMVISGGLCFSRSGS